MFAIVRHGQMARLSTFRDCQLCVAVNFARDCQHLHLFVFVDKLVEPLWRQPRHLPTTLISHNVSFKLFSKVNSPLKTVNLVKANNKLTILWGS